MGNKPVIVSHHIENDSIIVTATFTMPEGTVFGNGEGQIKGFGFVWSTDDVMFVPMPLMSKTM